MIRVLCLDVMYLFNNLLNEIQGKLYNKKTIDELNDYLICDDSTFIFNNIVRDLRFKKNFRNFID